MKIEPMATLTWTQVQSWIQRNPHATSSLQPFTKGNDNLNAQEQTDEDGWLKTKVTPSTPLSAILLVQDMLYQGSCETARRALLRDETTDLQEKSVLHLKGRAWPVRRTAEGLSACGLEEGRASSWPAIGWKALCSLRECQIVIVNEEKKEISFYPEDVRNWSSSVDTFCIEYECRFLWTHKSISKILSLWLSNKEKEGWTLHWPITDGTMEELKEQYKKLSLGPIEKVKKEALQKRLGREQTIATLSQWLVNVN
jgi:hypothetical protein